MEILLFLCFQLDASLSVSCPIALAGTPAQWWTSLAVFLTRGSIQSLTTGRNASCRCFVDALYPVEEVHSHSFL